MLLSSSAFSTFLNDLSSNGAPNASAPVAAPSNTQAASQQKTKPSPRKDVNPHQQVQSQQPSVTHVGMTMIPENTMDFSAFDSTNNAWATNMDFGFNNAAVFSVTELPQGPAIDTIDTGILSGKSSNSVGFYSNEEAKDDAPAIERMPSDDEKSSTKPEAVESSCADDTDFDESDPAFALFADYPPTVVKETATENQYQIFGEVEMEKAVARLDLIVDDEGNNDGLVSSATMARFERICSSLEAISERISAVTLHL